jgi:hypothetical protein
MHSKLILALMLSATLAASLTLNDNALAARPIPQAPDFGTAIMSAHVDDDGTLIGGAGAVGATRKANGLYFVAFNRSVQGCSHVGAVSGDLAVLYTAFVSTESNPDTFNGATYVGLSVVTANPNGLADDTPFHLLVFCPR